MISDEELEKNFYKVKIVGVYVANVPEGSAPVVFLENEEEKILPIYIGAAEAFSIQTALENVPYPRPLTHDLLVSMLEGLNAKIEKVLIDDLNEGIFFARIIMRRDGEIYEFDARPSDSLALAVRTKAPVYVAKRIMDEAGVDKKSYKIEK